MKRIFRAFLEKDIGVINAYYWCLEIFLINSKVKQFTIQNSKRLMLKFNRSATEE